MRSALKPHGYSVQRKMLAPRPPAGATQLSALGGAGREVGGTSGHADEARGTQMPGGAPVQQRSSRGIQRQSKPGAAVQLSQKGDVVQREGGDPPPPTPPVTTPLSNEETPPLESAPVVPDPAVLAADLPTESYTEANGEAVTLKIEVAAGAGSVKAGAVEVAAKSDSIDPMQLAGAINADVAKYLNAATAEQERAALLAKIKSDMKALKTAMARARGEEVPIISLRGTFEKDIGAKAFSGAAGFDGGHKPVEDMATAALTMIAGSMGVTLAAGQAIDAQLKALEDVDVFKTAIEGLGIPTTIGFAGAVGTSYGAVTNALTEGSLTQKCVHLINFGDKFIKQGLLDDGSKVLQQIQANLSDTRFAEFKAKVDRWKAAKAGTDDKETKAAGKGLLSEERFTNIVDGNGAMDTKTPKLPLEALDRQALFRLAAQKNIALKPEDTKVDMIEKLKAAGVKPETTSSGADQEIMPDKAGLTVEGMPYIEGIKANIVNPKHQWIIDATAAEMPLKAGISGTTHRFLGLGELLGVADKGGMRLAMLGHLQAIEAHSFWEICDAVGMGPPAGKYVPFTPVDDDTMAAAALETLQRDGVLAQAATGQADLTKQVERLLGTNRG